MKYIAICTVFVGLFCQVQPKFDKFLLESNHQRQKCILTTFLAIFKSGHEWTPVLEGLGAVQLTHPCFVHKASSWSSTLSAENMHTSIGMLQVDRWIRLNTAVWWVWHTHIVNLTIECTFLFAKVEYIHEQYLFCLFWMNVTF